MKVLHLADGPRNIRAERAAILGKKANINDQYIIGNIKEDLIKEGIFKGKKYIDLTPKNQLGLQLQDPSKKIINYFKEIDADFIHAHNIFMAKICLDLKLPFVYDDHELWSQKIKCYKRTGLKGLVGLILQRNLYPRWEKKTAAQACVFAPSNGIKEFYQKKYGMENVFLLPNMPLLNEVKDLPLKEKIKDDLISVSIGVSTEGTARHRNMDGFLDLWKENNTIGKIMIIGQKNLPSEGNIISTGRISHEECYIEASKGHVGFIPFKPYPKYHTYSGANKAYLYIHSGIALVTPITQTEFKPVIEKIGYGYQFENYEQIVHYLRDNRKELMNIDSKKIVEISRKEYILDNFVDNLKEAYKITLEKKN